MRLDLFLVQQKLAHSRTQAQEFIQGGFVLLKKENTTQILKKSSYDVTEDLMPFISVQKNDFQKYVSRAGLKLESAVHFLKLNIAGKKVLDVGQSTGGFTDFLLQNNAAFVLGFDVGQSQLHPSLKNHERMLSFEGLHVKDLANSSNFLKQVPAKGFDLIVLDVSFISLGKVIGFLKPYLADQGEYLFLVKPQFEVGPDALDKNGLVKEVKSYQTVENKIKLEVEQVFGKPLQFFKSQLTGKDGNQEFFIYGKNN